MIETYTVIEKSKMMNILQGNTFDFINNISIYDGIVDEIKEAISEVTGELSLFPCVVAHGNDNEIVDRLQEIFPINWKNHMVLKMLCDESRFTHFNYQTLLNISTSVKDIDSIKGNQFAVYRDQLNSQLRDAVCIGVSDDIDDVNILSGFSVDDITHFLILDDAFDLSSNDAAFAKANTNELEKALRMSLFQKF